MYPVLVPPESDYAGLYPVTPQAIFSALGTSAFSKKIAGTEYEYSCGGLWRHVLPAPRLQAILCNDDRATKVKNNWFSSNYLST